MRYQVAKNILKLQNYQYKQNHYTSTKTKQEMKLVKLINKKLSDNNAIIANADKGNSMVIIYRSSYDCKVMDFITINGASETTEDTIKVFQKGLGTGQTTSSKS
jgi:ribosomal protein S4E